MTEESPSRMRGHGPCPEAAEPTGPIPAAPPGDEPTAALPPRPVESYPPEPTAALPPGPVESYPPEPTAALPPRLVESLPPGAPESLPFEPAEAEPAAATAAHATGDEPTLPIAAQVGGIEPTEPISGSPDPAASAAAPAYGPFHGGEPGEGATTVPTSDTSDPYGFAPFTGRRIEPSPPPDRSRLLVGLVAGLVAGLLVFGTGGWFAGCATAPKPNRSLGVFEQSRAALNRPHFAGTGLTTIGEGWLPYLANCVRSGEPGGPTRNAGERVRVRCAIDGLSAIFAEYDSVADRDKARVETLGQNADARALTPGVGAAARRSTPSGRTSGNYVEYAYRLTEGGVTRTVAAIWWDDARAAVAGYLLAYWKEGLGESWAPMRDLWARYA